MEKKGLCRGIAKPYTVKLSGGGVPYTLFITLIVDKFDSSVAGYTVLYLLC